MELNPGIYFSPSYGNMVVIIDDLGFPHPLNAGDAEKEPKMIHHNLDAATLIHLWAPLHPVPIVGYDEL